MANEETAQPKPSEQAQRQLTEKEMKWKEAGLDPDTMNIIEHLLYSNAGLPIEYYFLGASTDAATKEIVTLCGISLNISSKSEDGVMVIFGNGRFFHLTPPPQNEKGLYAEYIRKINGESPLEISVLDKQEFNITPVIRRFIDNSTSRAFGSISLDSRNENQRAGAEALLDKAIAFSVEKVKRDEASQAAGRAALNRIFDNHFPPNHSAT